METKTPEMQKKGLTMGKAILKLSMYVNSGMLTINILKGRHLYSRYNCQCQPFVQVCLEPDSSGGTKCFTAVAEDTPHPVFNEKFSFEMLLPSDGKRRLHISVWNSNSPGHTAEFMGAMSFGLQHMLAKNKDHSGWYYLLKEDVGRRKHLPALLRSNVYEDVGALTCTENTPLMPHKYTHTSNTDTNVLADVIIHSDFNTTNPSDHTDRVNSTKKQTTLRYIGHNSSNYYQTECTVIQPTSPKQVRFNISKHSQNQRSIGQPNQRSTGQPTSLVDTIHNPSKSTVTSFPSPNKSTTTSTLTSASQNPFILQYRKEISAATNAGRNVHNDSGLTNAGRNVHNDFNDSGLNESTLAITGSPKITTSSPNDKTIPTSSIRSTLAFPSEFRTECLRASMRNKSMDSGEHSISQIREQSFYDNPGKCVPNGDEIWIDCQRLEAEHDSGICDSLSPSPKSDGQTSCCCCNKRYTNITDISITSDERIDGRTLPPGGQMYETVSTSQHKCQQEFQNKVYCGDHELSELNPTNNFDECENCLSNYFGLGRGLLNNSVRRSKRSNQPCNQAMHTKIYFL